MPPDQLYICQIDVVLNEVPNKILTHLGGEIGKSMETSLDLSQLCVGFAGQLRDLPPNTYKSGLAIHIAL